MVAMVDLLTAGERTTQHFLGNQAMLIDIAVYVGPRMVRTFDEDIAVRCDYASPAPIRMRGTRTSWPAHAVCARTARCTVQWLHGQAARIALAARIVASCIIWF